MDKGNPHHSLKEVQRLIRAGAVTITETAVQSAMNLNLGRRDILEVVRSLTTTDFYKSMTSYADCTRWQDVYHPKIGERTIYLKLTVRAGVLILSFKEK